MYLHKLQVTNIESLIPKQQQYLRHSKWPVAKALVGKGRILRMSKVFVKELEAVRWNPEPCL